MKLKFVEINRNLWGSDVARDVELHPVYPISAFSGNCNASQQLFFRDSGNNVYNEAGYFFYREKMHTQKNNSAVRGRG